MLPAIESIECFVAAARFLNFRAAARTVSLTPAAFGKRIAQLERQFGVVLFQRTTRKVELTEAGLALLPRAEELLEVAVGCGRAARGEVGPAPFTLTLGTRHELGLSWIVPMLDEIAESLPHVTFNLYFGSGPDLELRVRTAEIDCAVTSRRSSDPAIASARLHQEDYVFVAAPVLLKQHPLKKDADAQRHTLIDAHAEMPLFRYWRAAPKGGDRLRFGRHRAVGTIAAIRMLVLAGKGVAVLPRYLVQPDLKAKTLKVLFPKVTPQHDFFRLIYRADDPRKSVYQALSETMLSQPLK